MITDFLIDILYTFTSGIAFVVASFGTVSDNNAITTSIVTFKSYYNALNLYLPIDTIIAIIAFDLLFEGIYFIYKLVRWGYRKVPGIT
jgi:hypothetical protein